MLKDLKVKVGPQFYQYSIGAMETIPALLNEYHAKNILVVHGTTSWEKAQPMLAFLKDENYCFSFHRYTGECSYYGAELILKLLKEKEIDFLIGVGGGKLADLVGYSAHLGNVSFGIIPTLASNCAPWTPLSVMYKEDGRSEGKTEHFFRQAAFLIADPTLLIDAPVNYFIAGLADTLAKWYESEMILGQQHLKNESFLNLADDVSVLCKEAIIKDSIQAIEDMKNKKLSDEFIHLSEIIIAIAGMVGGLGDKYARNAAAHAMHDGISKFIPESHQFLHGEKVAYGIFYQLALENKWDEIKNLLPFYQKLELPVSLKQMGIYPSDEKIIEAIVDFIYSKEKVHLIPIEITKESLTKGMLELEEFIESMNKAVK